LAEPVAEPAIGLTEPLGAPQKGSLMHSLSRRQEEVLAGIIQNLTNKEIAAKLNLSERTVKFHVSALLIKFDVRGRIDLMLKATKILPHEAVHKRTP
jgi:DNA-binding NarL/FixJ family response regulator